MRDTCTDKQTAFLIKKGLPQPMGRNYSVFDLIEWLRDYGGKEGMGLVMRETRDGYWCVEFDDFNVRRELYRKELIDALGATICYFIDYSNASTSEGSEQ